MTQPAALAERFDLFAPPHIADPYGLYAQARTTQPVFYAPQYDAWVLTRYRDIRSVLSDPETFSSRNALRPVEPLCQDALEVFANEGFAPTPEPITADGTEHARLRGPLARALSTTQVAGHAAMIHAKATARLEQFAGRGQVEIMGAYAYPLPLEIICTLLGIAPEHYPHVWAASYDSTRVLSSRQPCPAQVQAARGMSSLHQLCADYARQRRLQPGNDLISQGVAALTPGDAPLTDEQAQLLGRLYAGVATAGHVTTSAAIGNALRHLLTHPQHWQRLCEQPELIPAAVEATLRLDAPVQTFFRITTCPVTVAGVELPEGAQVLLLFGAANRDEEAFRQPDTLDLDRQQPIRHLSFGHGVHRCVGAPLARRTLTTTLQLFTQRLPDLRLAEQTIQIEPATITRGPTALHLAWAPR